MIGTDDEAKLVSPLWESRLKIEWKERKKLRAFYAL